MTDTKPARIAVVVSHPIQHFCPQYSNWSKLPGVDLRVFFASDHGKVAYQDPGFGRKVQWTGLSLEFPHEFLPGASGKSLQLDLDSPELPDRLSAFAPDAVILYGYSQALQRRARRWADSTKTPTVMISDSELRTHRSFFKRVLRALILPRIYQGVRLFLTVGDANEDHYRRFGVSDDRLVRCFFPIDTASYDRVAERRAEHRARVRMALGLREDHHMVLMAGKLLRSKRQADLVRFANAIRDERDDITVVLAGTGPAELDLRALARRAGPGGVVFAGFLTPDELAAYYAAADVYVHCSERDAHSLAISEAIYSGLPVVVSDRCGSFGPTDDVQVGLNGFVYRCGDVDDLSDKVMQVIDDSGRLSAMGNASRRLGQAHQALAHGAALLQALAVLAAHVQTRRSDSTL